MLFDILKKATIFTALTILTCSSSLSPQMPQIPPLLQHEKNPQPLFQEALIPKAIDLSKVRSALEKKNYRQFRTYVSFGFGKNISEKTLSKLAFEFQDSGLKNALRASRALNRLSGTALSKKEALLLSLFIENELPRYVAKKRYYVTSKSAHLPRTVEHDPETKLNFIHLGTNKVAEIGRGYQKIVTKSILYDLKMPEVVANCKTSSGISREVMLMREMKGTRGLVETRAFTKHRSNHKTFTSIFCRLYNQGSLQLVMDKKLKFTFKEKVGMALNIMKGLSSLHKHKIIHRDLGARNYFVNIDKGKNGKRKVTAVVADLGRSYHFKGIKKDSSPQGNKYYFSSEMFFPEKMSPKDYTYSDLYATGCVFYRLLREKKAPWIDVLTNRNEHLSRTERSRRALHRLEHHTNSRRHHLRSKGNKLSRSEIFEKVIYQMIHPEPKSRGTAHEHARTLQRLYNKL